MNMISTGAFQNEMGASTKQETLAEKFARVWEKKNTKAARAGGVSLMALSLAACGSDDEASTPAAETPAAETPVAETPVVETPTTPVATALVAGTDTTGTTGSDSFTATTATLTADTTLVGTDDISGGEGADTLTLSMGANFGGFTVTGTNTGSMTGIETVELSAADAVARTFDATGVSGVETYKIDGTNALVNITDSADLAAIELSNVASGAFSITYAAATGGTSPVAGTADTLNMTVQGMGSSTADVTITAAGVEALALTSNAAATAAGATNYVNLSGVSNATSITVDGAADTDVAAVSAATTSFDASAVTGAVTAALGGAAASSLATVKTGAGADKATVAFGDLTANATVDMGAGDDSLTVTGAMGSATTIFSIKGVETADFTSATGTGTISMKNSDGITNINLGSGTAGYAGTLTMINDSGAKNIDITGASSGAFTTDSAGALDIDVAATTAATSASPSTSSTAVTANAATSVDISVSGEHTYTGDVTANAATSATITSTAGQAASLTPIVPAAETLTITSGAKGMTLDAQADISGAKVISVSTSGAFRDSSAAATLNGMSSVSDLDLSGAATASSVTIDALVGATTLTYGVDIDATGLKGGLTFSNGADAGSAGLDIDLTATTGAVSLGSLDGSSVNLVKGALGTLATGVITAPTVTINTSDALAATTLSTGSNGTGSGTADIVATTVTIDGSCLLATTADIEATAAATSLTASLDGGIAADLFSVTGNATVATITVSGELGLGADKLFVDTGADFSTNTTSTVTVNLDGVTKAGTTDTQTAVVIDVSATATNDLSVTGSKGSNDTVEFGTHTTVSDIDVTLSGIEKLTFDTGLTMKAANLSGQTIAATGDGANASIYLDGTSVAETVDFSGVTQGANADLVIDMAAGNDTITVGGAVADIVVSAAANGADTITGFGSSDQIMFMADDISSGNDADIFNDGTGGVQLANTDAGSTDDVQVVLASTDYVEGDNTITVADNKVHIVTTAAGYATATAAIADLNTNGTVTDNTSIILGFYNSTDSEFQIHYIADVGTDSNAHTDNDAVEVFAFTDIAAADIASTFAATSFGILAVAG